MIYLTKNLWNQGVGRLFYVGFTLPTKSSVFNFIQGEVKQLQNVFVKLLLNRSRSNNLSAQHSITKIRIMSEKGRGE